MEMNRRSFLRRSWGFIVALLGAEALWTSWDLLNPRVSEGFGSKIAVGPEQGYPPGEVRHFSNGRFYLVNLDGEFQALYQKCPHLGCRVSFCTSSARFECPCHGSVFNMKGELIEGPSPRGLDSFALEVGDEGIIVDTGTLRQGPTEGDRTLDEGIVGPSCLLDDQGNGGVHGAGEPGE